jgi:glycosyltransferase involved in cell wall biosynthesis
MSPRPNHVTVVVCTYNRAELLRDTLRSMQSLRTDDRFTYDVLIVDNASTDDTQETIAEIVRTSKATMSAVYEAKPGVAAARNRGLAEAQGEWIAFCDDDQEADPAWLLELLQMAQEQQVRIVGGAVKLALPDGAPQPALAVRRNFGESIGVQPHRYSKRVSPGTGNLLIHRSVIDQVGAFDENLRQAGEDTDLFRRIREAGIDAWYNPRAIVWHRIPAYRLTADYQRWSSQRTGWCFADRDCKESGTSKVLLIALARIAQAVLIRIPRLISHLAFGRRQEALGVRCDLWRCEGYVRFTLDTLAPTFLGQFEFRERINFRNERSTFDEGHSNLCVPENAQGETSTAAVELH